MKMNIKYKMEIDKVVLDLSHGEVLNLRTLLHDYIDNVEDGAIVECCDGMVETAKSLLENLDNMN